MTEKLAICQHDEALVNDGIVSITHVAKAFVMRSLHIHLFSRPALALFLQLSVFNALAESCSSHRVLI